MRMTLIEVREIMHDFHTRHKQFPNTILMPASETLTELDPIKFEDIFKMKVIFAAVPEPRVARL